MATYLPDQTQDLEFFHFHDEYGYNVEYYRDDLHELVLDRQARTIRNVYTAGNQTSKGWKGVSRQHHSRLVSRLSCPDSQSLSPLTWEIRYRIIPIVSEAVVGGEARPLPFLLIESEKEQSERILMEV